MVSFPLESSLARRAGSERAPHVPTADAQRRYDLTARVIESLPDQRAAELLESSKTRMGLAANRIMEARAGIERFIELVENREDLKSRYGSLIENLKEAHTKLGEQLPGISESAMTSARLSKDGQVKQALLAGEPAFNRRTGNSIQGLIDDVPKLIEELQSAATLLIKENPSLVDSYRKLILGPSIRSLGAGVAQEYPGEFTTGRNVKNGTEPPPYTLEAFAGAPIIGSALQALATSGLVTTALGMQMPSFVTDGQLIALPKSLPTNPRDIEKGNAAYEEMVRGTITEVRPKGSFDFPALGTERPDQSAGAGEPVGTRTKPPKTNSPAMSSSSARQPKTEDEARGPDAVAEPSAREERASKESKQRYLTQLKEIQTQVVRDFADAVLDVTAETPPSEVATRLESVRTRAEGQLERIRPGVRAEVDAVNAARSEIDEVDKAMAGPGGSTPALESRFEELLRKLEITDGAVALLDRIDNRVEALQAQNKLITDLIRGGTLEQYVIDAAGKQGFSTDDIIDITPLPFSISVKMKAESKRWEIEDDPGSTLHGLNVGIVSYVNEGSSEAKTTEAHEAFHSLGVTSTSNPEARIANIERSMRLSVSPERAAALAEPFLDSLQSSMLTALREEFLATTSSRLPNIRDGLGSGSDPDSPATSLDPMDLDAHWISRFMGSFATHDGVASNAETVTSITLRSIARLEALREEAEKLGLDEKLIEKIEGVRNAVNRAARSLEELTAIGARLDDDGQRELMSRIVVANPQAYHRVVEQAKRDFPVESMLETAGSFLPFEVDAKARGLIDRMTPTQKEELVTLLTTTSSIGLAEWAYRSEPGRPLDFDRLLAYRSTLSEFVTAAGGTKEQADSVVRAFDRRFGEISISGLSVKDAELLAKEAGRFPKSLRDAIAAEIEEDIDYSSAWSVNEQQALLKRREILKDALNATQENKRPRN